MNSVDWTRDPRAVYARLLRYAVPYWRHFMLGILGMALFAVSDTTLIWLMKPLLNGTFINKDPTVIRWTPIVLVVLFMVRGASGFVSTYGMSWVGRQVIKSMRSELFDHFLRLPTEFYDRMASGQLITHLTYHVEQVANSSTTAVTILVRNGLTVFGFLGLMLYTSWRLTLFALVVGPIIAVLVREISRRFRRYSSRIQDSMGDVTHVAEEIIIGHRVVKTFNGQPAERRSFEGVNERNRHLNMRLVATRAASMPLIQTITAFAIGGIVYYATTPAMLDRLSAGDFVVFMGALMGILNPIKQLTNVNAELQKGIAAAASIFKLLNAPLEDDGGERRLERARGDIRFEGVGFAYPHVGRTVLEDIDLAVEPGQTVAFVGRSGSGKSTLLSLLPRFYDPSQGRILLDGHDLRDYRREDLRRQVAFVDQNVTLFNDTVARNIAYGAVSETPREAIEEAARLAYAWHFIEALPEGLDTEVGQNGVMLSGGQRQRLAIARALLKRAPILILDEATSALDTESERHIQKALDGLMRSHTTLVIAHRLSTVQNADQIVVMDAGRVVEAGRHDELLRLGGHYASLYQMQFAGEVA